MNLKDELKAKPIQFTIERTTVELCQTIIGKGIVLSLFILPTCPIRQFIEDLDLSIIRSVQEHNEEWFSLSKKIDEAKIRQYFQPSIVSNSFSFITQPVMLPIKDKDESDNIYGKTVNATMVATGIKIYPKSFAIRYTLKNLTYEEEDEDDDEVGPTADDYVEMAQKINKRISKVRTDVYVQIDELTKRLTVLTDYIKSLDGLTFDKDGEGGLTYDKGQIGRLEKAEQLLVQWTNSSI